MTNIELLNASPTLLSAVDKQRRFILLRHARRMPCPNCGTEQNVFEATGVTIDKYDTDAITGNRAACISCKRALRYIVPAFSAGSPWHWALVPVPCARSQE